MEPQRGLKWGGCPQSEHKTCVVTALVQVVSGSLASFPLPPLPPPHFLLLPLLHSDHAWKGSEKARPVFGEPPTPDLSLVMHGSLDFVFMPKW